MKTNKQALIFALFIIIPAVCWAGGNKEKNNKPQPQTQTQPVQQTVPQVAQPPASLYWTGDGGRGKSITILPPKGTGLNENQANLLEVIAVELVSNFTKYSAMTVFDRVNNQRQYDELLSGYYADNDPAGLDLGHLVSTDYMLLGNITRTSTSYVLQLSINRNREKTTVAIYSETVPINVLENLTAVRQASLDLLQKMGIQNTQQARTELTRTATTEQVNARTLTAQGISAQRGGTVVEALSYYYEAKAFDPTLFEAANRASVLSTTITSGNIGENVRNDIQWRNEWVKILREAAEYFKKNPLFEIVYDPTLTQGKVNYNNNSVELSFNLAFEPSSVGFNIVSTIVKGLHNTGKSKEWGLDQWPYGGEANVIYSVPGVGLTYDLYAISARLLDQNGKSIGEINEQRRARWNFYSSAGKMTEGIFSMPSRWGITLENNYASPPSGEISLSFKNVKADDITDNLSISISANVAYTPRRVSVKATKL